MVHACAPRPHRCIHDFSDSDSSDSAVDDDNILQDSPVHGGRRRGRGGGLARGGPANVANHECGGRGRGCR